MIWHSKFSQWNSGVSIVDGSGKRIRGKFKTPCERLQDFKPAI